MLRAMRNKRVDGYDYAFCCVRSPCLLCVRIRTLQYRGRVQRGRRTYDSCGITQVDSVVIQAKCKGHGCSCFFHFSSCQPRYPIPDVAFGDRLEIVKVCGAGVR